MRKIVAVIALLFMFCGTAFAKPQTYTATGEYAMSPKETLEDGIKHAREDAMRQISESVGVYVESQSELKNQELTQDEIKTMSSNIIRVKSESAPTIVSHGSGLDIKVTVTAEADADDLFNKEKAKNEKLTEQNRNLEISSQGENVEAAFDFDEVCRSWLFSGDLENTKDLLDQASTSENPWKRACAYKWLGVLAFRDKDYEYGFQLCDKAIQIYKDEQASQHFFDVIEEIDLLVGMADVSASLYKKPDLAEKYMEEISYLNKKYAHDFIEDTTKKTMQHVEKAIEDLRNGEKPDAYDEGGNPSKLFVFSVVNS